MIYLCKQCGIEFTAKECAKRKYCGRSCYELDRYDTMIKFNCINCGESSTGKKGKVNKFCSKKCQFLFIRQQKVTCVCIICGAKFFKRHNTHNNQYCSKKCYSVGQSNSINLKVEQSKRSLTNWQNPEFVRKQMQSRHVTPNKTELKFLDIINLVSPLSFKYVGDGQLIVAGKCPDYVCLEKPDVLIELYGDYWHRGENPDERINLFAEKGYKTLVVWEKELKNIDNLKNKVLSFVGVN